MCYTYRRAGEPLEKEGNAISTQDDADEQRKAPTERVVSELQIPAAVVDRYETGERKKRHLEQAKLVIETLALVAVILYAGVTYFQLAEMRQTTWLAFQDRLDKIGARMRELDELVRNAPMPRDPAERPLADSGKAGTQPKAAAKDKQTAPGKKMESGAIAKPPLERQPSPAPDEIAREQARENIKIQRQLAEFTKWLVVATILGPAMLLAAVLCQAWIARDTERRQLRAYIGIKSGSINLLGDSKPNGTLVMTNAGQTPGHNVRTWARVQVFGLPINTSVLPRPSQENLNQLGASVVLPGSITAVNFERRDGVDGGVLTRDEREAIERGGVAVCIWGEILYHDAFNNSRVTTFRLWVSPFGVPRLGEGVPLTFLPQGNVLT